MPNVRVGFTGVVREALFEGFHGYFRGHLEAVLEAFWRHLGASWSYLGGSWEHFGSILGPLEAILQASWGHPGGFFPEANAHGTVGFMGWCGSPFF